jgi:ABC-type dipeptide/oligopeptide/nickel transport system permease subunit
MFFTSLIALTLGITFFYISANVADDIDRLVVRLIAFVLLFFSLIFAPLPIQLLIFIGLLIIAKQAYPLNQDDQELDSVLEKLDKNRKPR